MKNNKFFIIIPLYNDWKSLWKLINEIEKNIHNLNAEFHVIIVNDASTVKRPNIKLNLNKIKFVKILTMKNNVLSGKCIATGLKYVCEKEDFDYVIIMDADGEDRPEYLNFLFNKTIENPGKTITANRMERLEGNLFNILYNLHKFITWIFTDKLINFGNYSCLPRYHVEDLIEQGSLWNSFSGTVAKTIDARIGIKTDKGKRYYGPSQLSLLNIFIHSFTISSVFKKKLTIRTILFCVFFLLLYFISKLNLVLLIIFFLLVYLLINLFVSKRNNLSQLKSSIENIRNIEILK